MECGVAIALDRRLDQRVKVDWRDVLLTAARSSVDCTDSMNVNTAMTVDPRHAISGLMTERRFSHARRGLLCHGRSG